MTGSTNRRSTGPAAHRFFVARSGRLGDLLVKASLLFGVGLYGDPGLRPSGDLNQLKDVAPGIELIESNTFYHSDMDEDTVPAAGLEAVARAYARVIDDVNMLNLADIVDRLVLPLVAAAAPEWQATLDVTSLSALGMAGEFYKLATDELEAVISTVVGASAARQTLVGVSAPSSEVAARLA